MNLDKLDEMADRIVAEFRRHALSDLHRLALGRARGAVIRIVAEVYADARVNEESLKKIGLQEAEDHRMELALHRRHIERLLGALVGDRALVSLDMGLPPAALEAQRFLEERKGTGPVRNAAARLEAAEDVCRILGPTLATGSPPTDTLQERLDRWAEVRRSGAEKAAENGRSRPSRPPSEGAPS